MAPSDPPGTVLEVCLRVRQSGAIRVLVALVRMILDLWAAPPRCGYWESWGFFCSAPQDFGMLGVFYARFPPREARYMKLKLLPFNLYNSRFGVWGPRRLLLHGLLK